MGEVVEHAPGTMAYLVDELLGRTGTAGGCNEAGDGVAVGDEFIASTGTSVGLAAGAAADGGGGEASSNGLGGGSGEVLKGFIRETHLRADGTIDVVTKPHASPPRASPEPGLMAASRPALVVVDVQNDFLPGGALGVPDGNAVVPVINALREAIDFDAVVLTQDWHPEGHVSFKSASADGTWPDHCVANTQGARLASALNVASSDYIIRKGTDVQVDAYSGFGPPMPHPPTELEELLRAHNSDVVVVVGLALDYCVRATALDAHALGFTVYVVSDAVRPVTPAGGDDAKLDLVDAGVKLVTSQRLMAALGQ
ncbi:isochorismatase hydrolase [Thecamonas trahens ATCC 50062]|uniref:nicotinamidase n=1 Tax=Thecamonas trahens ATCC 50062 TaxID=461836 RepID=A0A0L0D9C6_THETB|nr:isochorismatase hydrolase [Thecamonas trahens ATCC 50062]KNC48651.1 isochorismatase hydrolase [Thecamonas trahens ATCC 50062]|eukprot:XP_013762707.1 isochorismatase hydrolase [Thecamonas trahens ATCC 50062]